MQLRIADAIRYALTHWAGLTCFLDDKRNEIDSNTVERSIRPITLNREIALFVGIGGRGENWAIVATLVESCKLNHVDPQAHVADILTKIANGHLNGDVDDLAPWAYAKTEPLRDVA